MPTRRAILHGLAHVEPMRISATIAAALAAACLMGDDALAQVIFSNTITGSNPSTSNPYTTGQTVADNLTASGIGRGTGINASSATDRYSATGWNSASLDTADYFTWTLTPASGYSLDLLSFAYTAQASGTGPTNFAFRTSVDGFTSDIGSPATTGATITLTSASFQGLTSAIEFRLYGWGASSGGGTFSVNDFSLTGSVSAVPEPSTYAALAGASLLTFAVWRRRRATAAIDEPTAHS